MTCRHSTIFSLQRFVRYEIFMMIKVFIFSVLALNSVLSEGNTQKFGETYFKQKSDHLFTPQENFKYGALKYGYENDNVLNRKYINPLENQISDDVTKYDGYAHHSDRFFYNNLAPPRNFYNIRPGHQVTNKIPSIKVDQPYYRTPPEYTNDDNYVSHENSKNTYDELARKRICVGCSNYDNELSNPTYQHENPALTEVLPKDSYLRQADYNFKQAYYDKAYIDPTEADKILIDKLNLIYSYVKNVPNIQRQNSTTPREPLFKSDPQYLQFKPYNSENNYTYRVKYNGLYPYGPKHVDNNPERVNHYYKSYGYNPSLEIDYGPKNYAPEYFEQIMPRVNNTKIGHVYYNPYFDFASIRNVSSRKGDDASSQDLTDEVLKKLLYSNKQYPYSRAYDIHSKRNNYHNYAPHNTRYYKNEDDDMIHYNPKNNYNQHINNLYHKSVYPIHNNYTPTKHLKDIVDEVLNIVFLRNKYGPYNKENQELYLKNKPEPRLNIHANEYTDSNKVYNDYGQQDMQRQYKHFKDVVEKVKLMQHNNKYEEYYDATDVYHPHERHYGKLTHPTGQNNVGVLYPYKVRPSPYILPEYRHQSQY